MRLSVGTFMLFVLVTMPPDANAVPSAIIDFETSENAAPHLRRDMIRSFFGCRVEFPRKGCRINMAGLSYQPLLMSRSTARYKPVSLPS